ncbi:MAG: T9SS type A sorting domain-containing protein [Melioribacteraceae bacterium]|nr:T9SS type A sorting domain-containing protein [Melioribacteraceae bacterium]
MPNSNNEDRVFWHKTVSSYFDSNNIAWSMWEFDDSFGIFEEASNKLFDHDLNVELINALGMNPPPQTEYFKRADTTGFSIFTDYIETDIISSGSASTGILDFYSTDYPYDGSYSVHWTGSDRYNKIGFNFIPDKDLSVLLNKNFAVDFWIKCDVAAARIDIRFVDTKTTNDDKPWRMRYTLDGSALSFNNQWQHLQIPLKEFNEHGAYEDGTWYNAQGLFDWTDVDIFDIVAEYGSLENINFWFDEIKIIDPSAVNVSTGEMFPSEFVLEQNYPNPFNPSTIISYSIPDDDYVTLKVYDILGNEIAVLIDDVIKSGRYKTEFDAQGLSSGIYFYQLYTKDIRLTGKMLLLK